jgi:hypothetical protein
MRISNCEATGPIPEQEIDAFELKISQKQDPFMGDFSSILKYIAKATILRF